MTGAWLQDAVIVRALWGPGKPSVRAAVAAQMPTGSNRAVFSVICKGSDKPCADTFSVDW
jgi:hypothetical protein